MNKFISLLIVCFFYINYGTAILSSKISPKGKVMLIRHAEKPPSGNDLSAMGWRRAECIRELFTKNETITPITIYAQKASKKDETIPDSRRQIETVAPLARALGITINNSFTSFELDELSKDIGELDETKFPVLVSWNHDEIKNFLINFGMKYQIAPTYPSKRYDLVWTIERDVNNEVQFNFFSQNCEGLGDYRFSNDASKISQQWLMKSLVIATITIVLFLF
ncbi:hypothetical protein H8356DRAFT_1080974 [Neocallimastix lanati (nom. inval.)]|jgi:hypothetical protein|uniref:Phosphoglycerate mutase-like protein n=1 Tax=Neocallimastix californiae TaxID=1754190 RepID=A0A1Y2ASX2_9FUNG|nr:hypothetical protein H8356DRAFT_1080974 [Neocallimastix sp. JGI-2020a]ORY25307.1 hypothetical protein LY90DRAFT_514229 [Neocallimastix californiae]|eukprot:ORY25307.1 hypothetical protein LY90DRAFT_514229 [Neocallimastix californiae]